MQNNMLVSVCVVTYNHKLFIEETIKSVLKQKTNFSYEIIISDDCSKDGTWEICENYANIYTDKIRLVSRAQNLGMARNWSRALSYCKGEFIALCEGDDYWIDENKLQLQVDFLQSNPDYAICFHKTLELKFDGVLEVSQLDNESVEKTYTLQDLAKGNIMHTASVVYRNNLIHQLPLWFNESPVVDYVLHMLNARHGLIKYFPQPMAVYRIHSGGTWSLIGIRKNYEYWHKLMDFLLREDFSVEVKEKLLYQKRSSAEKLLLSLMNERHWDEFLRKLEFYSAADDFIARQWAIKHFPEFINRITNSKTYKFSKSLQSAFKKIKRT